MLVSGMIDDDEVVLAIPDTALKPIAANDNASASSFFIFFPP